MTLDTTLLEIRTMQAQLKDQLERVDQIGSGGGGGSSMDQRLSRLESQYDRLDDRIVGLRDEVVRIGERMNHLPTKEYMLSVVAGSLTIIAALIAFADKIRALVS